MSDSFNQDKGTWRRIITFRKESEIEIKDQLTKQFDQIKRLIATWYKVKVPKDQDVSFQQIETWLETIVTARYYWDKLDAVNDPRTIWLESKDDLIFYNLVWNMYD